MATAYEVLGIGENATERQIRTAHRELARRWHPDRFSDGPERLWAESKMVQINIAYEDALASCAKHSSIDEMTPESDQFSDVRKLMDLNQLPAARQALMRIASRTAEWNYLFGAVLFRLGEVEKSKLYFSIATKQCPDDIQYQTAFMSATSLQEKAPRSRIQRLFGRR